MTQETSDGNADGGRGAPPAAAAGAQRGAPVSNTAPQKYSAGQLKRVLRVAVDSLYLSYPGEIGEKWRLQLERLKLLAQSSELKERAQAQARIGKHIFEARDKGRGRFAWVLDDNAFSLSVSAGRSLPLAYAQVRSEYLAFAGPRQAEQELGHVVNTLGLVKGPASVSRIDLCVDFETDSDPGAWPVSAWVTRAHRIEPHYQHQRFSGWSIGRGGAVSVRLYDKTLEIRTKRAGEHIFEIWESAGWTAGGQVWRLEAQLKRLVLKELGIETLEDALTKLRGLWDYVTADWLRLCAPNGTDDNRARWPDYPLWSELSAVDWGSANRERLMRFCTQRIPSDDKLIPAGSGYILSLMARDGITSWPEGVEAFAEATERHYEERGRRENKSHRAILDERLKERQRRCNMAYNAEHAPWRLRQIKADAEAYRRAKHGEDGDNVTHGRGEGEK